MCDKILSLAHSKVKTLVFKNVWISRKGGGDGVVTKKSLISSSSRKARPSKKQNYALWQSLAELEWIFGIIKPFINKFGINYDAVVGDYINKMKTTFDFKFLFISSFYIAWIHTNGKKEKRQYKKFLFISLQTCYSKKACWQL